MTFIDSLHVLTIPSILAPTRLMLAGSLAPHGLSDSKIAVEYFVHGLLDSSLPPRLPCRILPMR